MRILLVNPRCQVSIHTWTEVEDITGCTSFTYNLALPTLAALAPSDVEVQLYDEMVETRPIPTEVDWDLVGITGYISQRTRMFELADAFRAAGRLVAIGGPFASLSPSTVRPHADILFIGEAERTWPAFLREFRGGSWKTEYRDPETVDITASPLPQVKKMPYGRYFMGISQTSRGCPFQCEFCDVIVYLGRKQRHKQPSRVVQELDALYDAGYRRIFLSDDNFTAYRRKATGILEEVRAWNDTKEERVGFATQLSIDVAKDEELLDLCANAGLEHAFIGVETPDDDALKSVKKNQNRHRDIASEIRRFHKRGTQVQAGLIVGFDTDTRDCFANVFDFTQRAGVPIATASILNAPEGTPLEKRLSKEGRIRSQMAEDLFLSTNIVPKRMTREELVIGAQWLLNRLYSPTHFLERLELLARDLPEEQSASSAGSLREAAKSWQRIVSAYRALGPEMRRIPQEAVSLFRGKSLRKMATALIYYRQVVGAMVKGGIWEPDLGRQSAPDFGRRALRPEIRQQEISEAL